MLLLQAHKPLQGALFPALPSYLADHSKQSEVLLPSALATVQTILCSCNRVWARVLIYTDTYSCWDCQPCSYTWLPKLRAFPGRQILLWFLWSALLTTVRVQGIWGGWFFVFYIFIAPRCLSHLTSGFCWALQRALDFALVQNDGFGIPIEWTSVPATVLFTSIPTFLPCALAGSLLLLIAQPHVRDAYIEALSLYLIYVLPHCIWSSQVPSQGASRHPSGYC